jgi:hypothetical protein
MQMNIPINDVPDALCMLDQDRVVMLANRRFQECVSSISVGLLFVENFIGRDDHDRFRGVLSKHSAQKEKPEHNKSRRQLSFICDCDTLTSTSMYYTPYRFATGFELRVFE